MDIQVISAKSTKLSIKMGMVFPDAICSLFGSPVTISDLDIATAPVPVAARYDFSQY
jgi:hypothetical protein